MTAFRRHDPRKEKARALPIKLTESAVFALRLAFSPF
jgi:hypothetical protein